MRTFSIQTLGCKVNQYESEQLATVLRGHGLTHIDSGGDVRIVNTCSVTMEAASKSRSTVRRATRLPVLGQSGRMGLPTHHEQTVGEYAHPTNARQSVRSRTIVTGCWATSDQSEAANLPNVDAVLTHREDVAAELGKLLRRWSEIDQQRDNAAAESLTERTNSTIEPPLEIGRNDGWMNEGGIPAELTGAIKPFGEGNVNEKIIGKMVGTTALPLLPERQAGHQRGFLKIQDGCDAHCTYCIIRKLRPRLWSKPTAWVPQVGVLADLCPTASLRGTGLGVPRPVAPGLCASDKAS